MITAMKPSRMQQELALGGEIGFAGLVNQFGDFAHGVVDRHVAKAREDDETEDESEGADNETAQQEVCFRKYRRGK